MYKHLIIFPQKKCEYNTWSRLNAFIREIRDMYERISVVLPTKVATIISEADDFISCNDNFLDTIRENYPQLHHWEEKLDGPSIFHETVMSYIKNDPDLLRAEIISITPYEVISLENPNNINLLNQIYRVSHGGYRDALRRDWEFLKKYISSKPLLNPSLDSKKKMEHKFESHIKKNKKNYLLISRSTTLKSVRNYNTKIQIPELEDHIRSWTNNGIGIINIGFPPASYDNMGDSYLEIEESLSHDEVLSIASIVDGTIISGSAGGYLVHILGNVDLFILTEDWGITLSKSGEKSDEEKYNLISVRKNRNEVKTIANYEWLRDVNFSGDFLLSHNSEVKKDFSITKNINYIL